MPTATKTDPFWVDDHYDYDKASDGRSRYGAYLRQASRDLAGCDGLADFAWIAWKTATAPVMSPGYVREHPRISSSRCGGHDDGVLAVVELITPPPAPLARLTGFSGWERENGCWWEPSDTTIARRPAMLTTVELRFVIRADRLPAPTYVAGEDVTGDAKAVVKALVAELNERLRPVIEAIEDSGRDW